MTSASSATTQQPVAGALDARADLVAEQARDEERRRIARDLHDDISQQLALLTIDLQRLRQQVGTSRPELGERVDAILTRAQEIGADVRHVSHQLHVSPLGDLGLAIRGWCQEIAAHYNVDVRVTCERLPSSVDGALSLALFRIVQEALHNVVSHSGARHATVEIAARADGVFLRIVDDGHGFNLRATETATGSAGAVADGNPEAGTDAGTGIGLANIRERLAPFGGRLSISSAPSQGTRLEISVPLWREQPAAA